MDSQASMLSSRPTLDEAFLIAISQHCYLLRLVDMIYTSSWFDCGAFVKVKEE